MTTLFKVTKKSLNGQNATVFVESENFKTVRGLLQHRREHLMKMLMFDGSTDSIIVDIVKDIGLTDQERVEELEAIQDSLDHVQNKSKNILKQNLYDDLYNLRCAIQDQMDDLKEEIEENNS